MNVTLVKNEKRINGKKEIYLLAITNLNWLHNIVQSGTTTVNYWTQNWIPDPNRNIEEVHFCKDGRVVAIGKFRCAHKDDVKDVYSKYGNVINGLKNGDVYSDFIRILEQILPANNILGNIIVDEFQYKKEGFEVVYNVSTNKRGRYLPASN